MTPLPIDAVLDDFRAALAAHPNAVLVAPPGAGKTTRAPLALLQEPWTQGKKILLLSPRRIAARAAAAHMAQSLGEAVGETVGLRVRLETRVSKKTRIEVMTEGVFTRAVLADPGLEGVACVLFDEVHERSLESDLGLALALDAQAGLRTDLRLVAMSATLDGARVASLLGEASRIEAQGRMFPVDVRHIGRDARAPLPQAMADAVRRALREESGSVLCFLPGAGEIERTLTLLREAGADKVAELFGLYGALDPQTQDRAIAPTRAGARKVVLATSIAETSLTIEGVRVVIDSGFTRRPHFEPGTGMSRLETVRVSQAAATQRAGRAGRLEPGVCWRLWQEGETRALPAFDKPEILDADLSGLALDLAEWGAKADALHWLDAPPKAALQEAIAMLRALGALDVDGRITAHGKVIGAMPIAPRLAHMIVRARENGEGALAAHLAMVVSEQGLGGRDVDVRARLDAFLRDRSPRASAAKRVAQRLGGDGAVDSAHTGAVLALAYPERVAKARGAPGAFLMANGRAAHVNETDILAREKFLAIAEVTGRADRAVILSAAPLTQAEIEHAFGDAIVEEDTARIENGVYRGRRVRRLGRIVLSEAPLERVSQAQIAKMQLDHVRDVGLSALTWDDAALQLRARVALLRTLEGDEAWPDWSDERLIETVDVWLFPHLSLSLDDVRVETALRHTLDDGQWRRLQREAPEKFETPAASLLTIDYVGDGAPAVDVRLQELFGVKAHPCVASGRAPLLLRLLSPAHRPVQTTRDLPGFWAGSYASVRSDMRGRYPKHPWPDDPANAEPTRRVKPKGS
jgi:ATP-dependent helicase HrpB